MSKYFILANHCRKVHFDELKIRGFKGDIHKTHGAFIIDTSIGVALHIDIIDNRHLGALISEFRGTGIQFIQSLTGIRAKEQDNE